MTDDLKHLLNEAVSHLKQGVPAELLRYLCEHSEDRELAALSEKMIGIKMFKRSGDWNPQEDSIVRQTICELRRRLDDFYLDTIDGKASRDRIEIKSQPYRVEIVKNLQTRSPSEKFWAPYMSKSFERMLVFTEPLFFFDSTNRCYMRFLDINHDTLNEKEIHDKIRAQYPEGHPALSLKPCFHYEAIGEKRMTDRLTEWFKKKRRPIDRLESSRLCLEDSLADCNVILLGNARTNRYISGFQDKLDFHLGHKEITLANPDPEKSEQAVYVDEDQRSYAVVTRVPNIFEKRAATLLASNNGKAADKVSEYLTSDSHLQNLFRWMKSEETESVPQCFQVLFKVEMHGVDVAHDPTPVAWRSYEKPRVAARGAD